MADQALGVAGPGQLPFSGEKAEMVEDRAPGELGVSEREPWSPLWTQSLGREEGCCTEWSSWPDSEPGLLGKPASQRSAGSLRLLSGRGRMPADSAAPWKHTSLCSLLLPPLSGLPLESGEAFLHECIQDTAEWVYW